MVSDPAFREVQRFRQWWLWTILGGIALVMLAAGPAAWLGLGIVGAVAAFVYSLRLETEVGADGISLRMWPIHRSYRRIAWSEIEQYEVTKYRPLREFGGWGIRWAPGKIAYTVGGNRGVWIRRPDDRDVLVGSRRAEELVDAIDLAVE